MLNLDFNQRIIIDTTKMQWEASPAVGVKRKRLAFDAVESGHATSIVEFEAGSSFRRHEHPRGEEILVLSGVFSDELGDYHAGTYIRNPEGFAHAPFSQEGCEILVKLHQFQANDKAQVRVDYKVSAFTPVSDGFSMLTLHRFEAEHTALVRYSDPAQNCLPPSLGGEEIYVISGELRDEFGQYSEGCWLRSPQLSEPLIMVKTGTLLLVKRGHLSAHH